MPHLRVPGWMNKPLPASTLPSRARMKPGLAIDQRFSRGKDMAGSRCTGKLVAEAGTVLCLRWNSGAGGSVRGFHKAVVQRAAEPIGIGI